MKRKKQELLFLGAAILVVVLLLGGIYIHLEKQKPEKVTIKVGVTVYRDDDVYINSIIEEMEKIFRQQYSGEISLNIVSAQGSQNQQNEQVERFISLGYDAICVNAVDRTDVGRIVDLAVLHQVPLVFFNREPVDDDLYRGSNIYYLGSDARESAQLQGQLIAEQWEKNRHKMDLNLDGVLTYAILEGERGHQDAVIRTEWGVRSLENAGIPQKLIISGVADWERDQSAALVEQWMGVYGSEIELFLCNNDDMALGAIDTLEKIGRNDVNVVGIDGIDEALEAVKHGRMLGTICADRARYGKALLEMSLKLAKGEKISEETGLRGKNIWIPWEIKKRKD